MTNIHFPVDGQGTQSLQKQNKADKSSFHVDATAPDSKNQNKKPAQKNPKLKKQQPENNSEDVENKTTNQQTAREKTPRHLDRRQDNRRKENKEVLLNTRSEQDRRNSSGQREEDLTDKHKQFGIDTKA